MNRPTPVLIEFIRGLSGPLVILATDLLTSAADAIPRTQVMRTYRGAKLGKLVYARDAPGC